jgi:two-component system response regulator (stage 0 sporulation protein A)
MNAKNCVIDLLFQLGVRPNLKGFQYIRDAILILLKHHGDDYAMMKLYQAIAEQHGVTISRVERAIRHAIEVIYERGDMTKVEWLFGYVDACKGKATNKEFLYALAERTSQMEETDETVDCEVAGRLL